MAQFDLVRQCFTPRCHNSFFQGLFQGFYVIACRQEGGLNFCLAATSKDNPWPLYRVLRPTPSKVETSVTLGSEDDWRLCGLCLAVGHGVCRLLRLTSQFWQLVCFLITSNTTVRRDPLEGHRCFVLKQGQLLSDVAQDLVPSWWLKILVYWRLKPLSWLTDGGEETGVPEENPLSRA